jgi:mannose-6-phosphate isomerase-like protein (cupin superfamily)
MHLTKQIAAIGLSSLFASACVSTSAAQLAETDDSLPAIVLNSGEGTEIEFPLHATTRLASATATDSGLSLFEIIIKAKAAGAPPHKHTHEDEFFYVREGSITFLTDGVQKTIFEGGLALLPRGGGGWHAMWNDADADATLLVGASDGQFDDFFDAVAMQAAAAGDLTPPEIGAIVGRVGAERGIIIDMSRVPDQVRPLYGMPPVE